MPKRFFRENLCMVGSSLEFLFMFGAMIFVLTIAIRVALDAVTELETALGKLL